MEVWLIENKHWMCVLLLGQDRTQHGHTYTTGVRQSFLHRVIVLNGYSYQNNKKTAFFVIAKSFSFSYQTTLCTYLLCLFTFCEQIFGVLPWLDQGPCNCWKTTIFSHWQTIPKRHRTLSKASVINVNSFFVITITLLYNGHII